MADGRQGSVVNVTTQAKTQEMFNLTVETAHTFYVGTQGWLVHNCGTEFSLKYGVAFEKIQLFFNGKGAALDNLLAKTPDITSFTRDFQGLPKGPYKTVKISDRRVMAAIEEKFGGTRDWVKVFEDGYDQTGVKNSLHYYLNTKTQQVFGMKFKGKGFWSSDGIG